MFLKFWKMAQDRSVRIKRCWHWTKNSNKYEQAVCGVSFLTSLDFMASCVFGTGQPWSSNRSQSACPVYSHTNSVGMGNIILPFFLMGLLHIQTFLAMSEHLSISTTLPLIISSKPRWWLNLKQSVVGWSHTDPHLARPVGGRASSAVCFLEVSGCSSRFHNSLKSFPWRSLRGCNWEQMRRPLRASLVMSALVEGKAWRDRGGRGKEAGGYAVSQYVWEAADSLQVYRWADWQQRHCKTQPKSSHIYQTRKKYI